MRFNEMNNGIAVDYVLMHKTFSINTRATTPSLAFQRMTVRNEPPIGNETSGQTQREIKQ